MSEFEILINNRSMTVREGTTVAAAILRSSKPLFRTSVSGEFRSALCGMGICYECRVTINSVPHVRSCQTLVEPGMKVLTE